MKKRVMARLRAVIEEQIKDGGPDEQVVLSGTFAREVFRHLSAQRMRAVKASSARHTVLSQDPKAIRHRERQRVYRERKRQAVIAADAGISDG